jgi:hypothetical protein
MSESQTKLAALVRERFQACRGWLQLTTASVLPLRYPFAVGMRRHAHTALCWVNRESELAFLRTGLMSCFDSGVVRLLFRLICSCPSEVTLIDD